VGRDLLIVIDAAEHQWRWQVFSNQRINGILLD